MTSSVARSPSRRSVLMCLSGFDFDFMLVRPHHGTPCRWRGKVEVCSTSSEVTDGEPGSLRGNRGMCSGM